MNQTAKKEVFYQVTREEILMLRQNGLINNTALVFFALKLENPWCDRPVKIKTKEFAVAWGIPESSLYAAIAKLKELKVIKTGSAELTVAWTSHSQQGGDSRNLESALGSENELQDLRINSENLEKQQPEGTHSKGFGVSHTSSDYSDFKEKKKSSKPKKKSQEFDEWFGYAYSQGWVAGRQGTNVILKTGPLAGCMRHWKEVSQNLEYYLQPSEPLKPGSFASALKKGFQIRS